MPQAPAQAPTPPPAPPQPCGPRPRWRGARRLLALALGTGTALAVWANMGPIPMSLKGVPVPPVPGLLDGSSPIVIDKDKAIALGKALFWDQNVGSDGMACASCHFHAGADRRVRNQLHPRGSGNGAAVFETAADGTTRRVNDTLARADFPLNQWPQPLEETAGRAPLRQSDDVVGSAGSFGGRFRGVDYQGAVHDDCSRSADAQAQLGGVGARRVTDRHAPSVINAVFNHKLMWDGRAHNIFNGSSAWGPRDTQAGVWVAQGGTVSRQTLALPNSALASQAMLPPVNEREMSCSGRTLADLGRKLLYRTALEGQRVHPQDSVLGRYARGNGQAGLTVDYLSLVQQAFAPRYWSWRSRGPFGAPADGSLPIMRQPYSQVEANFPLFFGLALQLYQSTLVSDDAPFDRSARNAANLPTDLTPAQLRGLQQFRDGHCALCHTGPAFTAAAVDTNAALVAAYPWAFGDSRFRNSSSLNVVTRQAGSKGFGFIDTGFAATGVATDGNDPGLQGLDRGAVPVSYAAQFLQWLAGNGAAVVDSRVRTVRACDLPNAIALDSSATLPYIFTQAQGVVRQQVPGRAVCINPGFQFLPTPQAAAAELASAGNRRMLAITDAAFKIPGLRNIELTGPYMHNGSMATLDEVIEFYARGGNFVGASKQFGTVFPQPALQLDAQARADLRAFLESLTDERVRYERAPFDHPELSVPHGHTGSRTRLQAGNPLGADLALDEPLLLPAVGASGRSSPLLPFSHYLNP